jgi:hypothetical protein
LTWGTGKKARKVPASSKVFCCFADVFVRRDFYKVELNLHM